MAKARPVLVLLVFLLPAGAVRAQDDSGLIGPPILQFSFSNPGARSMGFGGAFVALADDATAAFANPAGLVQIAEPEVSLEGRSWSYSTPFTRRGRIAGEPTGVGVDVVAGLETASSSYDSTGLSFFSFVYPRKKGSIGFYRHQLADFASLTRSQALFADGTREFDRTVRTDLAIVSYGLAGAYRFSDALSLGLGMVYFDAEVEILGELFLYDLSDPFAPTSFRPDRSLGQTSIRVDDTNWGLTLGFLWSLSPQWRLGGAFRSGPSLELLGEARTGPAAPLIGLPPAGTILDLATSPIGFPDVYGLGCSFRSPDGRLTLGFEWDRVEYSSIIDSLDPRDFETFGLILADGDELHLGGEFVFLRSTPLTAVRLGVWHDPDHQPRVTASQSAFEQALLRPGDDEIHWAFGLGLAFEAFQIDLAADFSELVDSVSLSAIYSF